MIIPPECVRIVVRNRFILGRRLGEGSFGVVHEAFDTQSDRDVAIKLELIATSTRQLEHEVRAYRHLKGVSCIPRKIASGVQDEYNYMVLDLMDTTVYALNLHTPKDAISLGWACVNALQQMHDCGLVHRDIKPANLGVTKTGLKLLDLGTAARWRLRDGTVLPDMQTRPGGTQRYMSVAVEEGSRASRRDDLVAVGFMMLECILGEGNLPWSGMRTCIFPSKADERRASRRRCEKKDPRHIRETCPQVDPVILQYIDIVCNLAFLDPPPYAELLYLLSEPGT